MNATTNTKNPVRFVKLELTPAQFLRLEHLRIEEEARRGRFVSKSEIIIDALAAVFGASEGSK